MICPRCKSPNVYVVEGRSSKRNRTYRRLKCRDCGERFFSREEIIEPEEGRTFLSAWHKVAKERRERFGQDKSIPG